MVDAPTTPLMLEVEHLTRYAYSAPVELAQHMAFLRPIDDAVQRVESFEMDVAPAPLHQTTDRDRFGNVRSFFTVAGAHRALSVHTRCRVRLAPPAAPPALERTLPGSAVRERLRYAAGARYEPASEFCVPSPFVPRLDALAGLVQPPWPPSLPIGLAAAQLMEHLHAHFEYEPASTQIDTPLADVLAARRGVCQDFAHLMIGALRRLGLAARYVSGYLLTTPSADADEKPLLGADASHAWVAVWCPGSDGNHRWLEFDPTNRLRPHAGHVRLAWGRDFGDVTPLRGVIRGGGEHTLAVHVRTERVA